MPFLDEDDDQNNDQDDGEKSDYAHGDPPFFGDGAAKVDIPRRSLCTVANAKGCGRKKNACGTAQKCAGLFRSLIIAGFHG
jgi:hypothetical protein